MTTVDVHPGQGVAEQHRHEGEDEHPERRHAAEQPEPRREAQGRDGEPRDAVDREPDHLAQRVLRASRGACGTHVADRRAGEPEGRHDEAQHPVVLRQGVDGIHRGPRHEAEVARVDVGVDLGQRADRAVERPGAQPLEGGVGRAVLPHAVDDVDVLAARDGQHLADDLGRVLQVGVDGHDPAPAGPGQPGRDRRLVPGVRPQPHDAHLRPRVADPLEQHRRAVGRAVVDAEHLVGHAPPVGHGPQPLDEEGEDVLLVVDRDDDGEVETPRGIDRRVRHGPRVDRPAPAAGATDEERSSRGPPSMRSGALRCRPGPTCRAGRTASGLPRDGGAAPGGTGFDSGRRPRHPAPSRASCRPLAGPAPPGRRAGRERCAVIRTTCPLGPFRRPVRRVDPGRAWSISRPEMPCRASTSGRNDVVTQSRPGSSTARRREVPVRAQGCGRLRWTAEALGWPACR